MKNICISSTLLCLSPLNLSFKLNFNISKKAYCTGSRFLNNHKLFFHVFGSLITAKKCTKMLAVRAARIFPLMIERLSFDIEKVCESI